MNILSDFDEIFFCYFLVQNYKFTFVNSSYKMHSFITDFCIYISKTILTISDLKSYTELTVKSFFSFDFESFLNKKVT
jgi:hypothetical protein